VPVQRIEFPNSEVAKEERITKLLQWLWQSAHSALKPKELIAFARHVVITAKKLRFSTSKKTDIRINSE
jgi:hypothetical protein